MVKNAIKILDFGLDYASRVLAECIKLRNFFRGPCKTQRQRQTEATGWVRQWLKEAPAALGIRRQFVKMKPVRLVTDCTGLDAPGHALRQTQAVDSYKN